MKITHFTYLVRDYDEAVAWFARVFGFKLVEDTDLGGDKLGFHRTEGVAASGHPGQAQS